MTHLALICYPKGLTSLIHDNKIRNVITTKTIGLSNMTQRSLFSINRTKYFSKPQAFAKVTYHGFFKCEGKCYPNTWLELCWKMLLFIIFYINFMFILFLSFQVFILFPLCFMSFYITLYFILTNRCYCCLF